MPARQRVSLHIAQQYPAEGFELVDKLAIRLAAFQALCQSARCRTEDPRTLIELFFSVLLAQAEHIDAEFRTEVADESQHPVGRHALIRRKPGRNERYAFIFGQLLLFYGCRPETLRPAGKQRE